MCLHTFEILYASEAFVNTLVELFNDDFPLLVVYIVVLHMFEIVHVSESLFNTFLEFVKDHLSLLVAYIVYAFYM